MLLVSDVPQILLVVVVVMQQRSTLFKRLYVSLEFMTSDNKATKAKQLISRELPIPPSNRLHLIVPILLVEKHFT